MSEATVLTFVHNLPYYLFEDSVWLWTECLCSRPPNWYAEALTHCVVVSRVWPLELSRFK